MAVIVNGNGTVKNGLHFYRFLDLFQLAIQQSGTILTCLEGALGFSGLSFDRAQRLCNYTTDLWNSRNYTALKDCLQTMDYHQWLKYEPVNFFDFFKYYFEQKELWPTKFIEDELSLKNNRIAKKLPKLKKASHYNIAEKDIEA